MTNTTQRDVRSVYEELKGALSAIPDQTWFDDEGFSERVNTALSRASMTCPEISDIDSYKIKSRYLQNRGAIIDTAQAKVNLNTLLGRMRGMYDVEEKTGHSGHTFIQNQNQQVNIEFLLDIRGVIEKQITNYDTGKPERTFLEKIKDGLSATRSSMEVLRLILASAGEAGVTIDIVRKIFGW